MVCGCLFSRRPPRRSRRRLGRQRTAIGAERFRRGILLLRRPVLPPVHRPVFTFHHVVGFGALVLCVGGNGIIHSAHKAIQGDDCRPRRSSRLRFPWLTPIRNSFELRCLYRLRSYFGPRTCGRGITNSSKHFGALNQGFPFSFLQCRQGNMGGEGLRDAPEYKLIGCIQDHHQRNHLQGPEGDSGR